MMHGGPTHPYIPSAAPEALGYMMARLGVERAQDLYGVVPAELRFNGTLNLPSALAAEADLRREIELMLSKNVTTKQYKSYLGGGCWEHYVPAVCDEIGTRSEFVTAYHDGPRGMLGSYQAQFEFQTMLGELVGMDAVSTTTYDWAAAAGSAILMASRITERQNVVVHGAMSPERLLQMRTMTRATMNFREAAWDPRTGAFDLPRTLPEIDHSVACLYIEVPSYLGVLDPGIPELVSAVHAAGGLVVVGVDLSSLGILAPPASYGADLVVGELQPLGIHMYAGGGCAGFIATRQEERFLSQFQTLLVSLMETEDDEYVFAWTNFEDTSYGLRDTAPDFTGTTQTIWSIVAASYLALMGPTGMRELGETIRQRSRYAINRLCEVPGISVMSADAAHFKEFVVQFDDGLPSVAEINERLLTHRIFGGLDLSASFPELSRSSLYCVTEMHSGADLDQLARALAEVTA